MKGVALSMSIMQLQSEFCLSGSVCNKLFLDSVDTKWALQINGNPLSTQWLDINEISPNMFGWQLKVLQNYRKGQQEWCSGSNEKGLSLLVLAQYQCNQCLGRASIVSAIRASATFQGSLKKNQLFHCATVLQSFMSSFKILQIISYTFLRDDYW